MSLRIQVWMTVFDLTSILPLCCASANVCTFGQHITKEMRSAIRSHLYAANRTNWYWNFPAMLVLMNSSASGDSGFSAAYFGSDLYVSVARI